MIDATKQAKLQRFIADDVMADAVKEVLLSAFLKERTKLDVQTLAAERLAINLLEEAWKVLRGYRPARTQEKSAIPNPGV